MGKECMTWLFSKALCESLHCSPGPVAGSSEATCSDGEPYAQLNVMPTPHKFSRNDKTMDVLSLSRFGLTLRLLTESRGEELLTLFRAGFPARTSAQPEKAPASTESAAAYGEKWRASFAKYDLDLCSWKTRQFSLLGGLDEFSENWPRWGLMLNGECWERPTLEHSTSESESGFMPTPTAQDNNQVRGVGAAEAHKNRGTTLGGYARMWPTPTSTLGSNGGRITPRKGREGGTLIEAVSARMWETPLARDSKSGLFTETGKAKSDTHSRGKPLSEQIGGQLNPTWVEWLMGFPIGWTELKPLEMHKFQEWQQQHSIYSDGEAA